MKRIPLTQGKFATVDNEDYERLSKHKWHLLKCPTGSYAQRNIPAGGRKQKKVQMHRVIMQAPDDMQVDHIDRDGLNNQRNNMRLCTHAQNQRNRRTQANFSGYKGVNWNNKSKKWQVYISVNDKAVFLGSFFCPIKAAVAYDKAAIRYSGEFARLNFPHLDRRGLT